LSPKFQCEFPLTGQRNIVAGNSDSLEATAPFEFREGIITPEKINQISDTEKINQISDTKFKVA
jgi:hypothetical protein